MNIICDENPFTSLVQDLDGSNRKLCLTMSGLAFIIGFVGAMLFVGLNIKKKYRATNSFMKQSVLLPVTFCSLTRSLVWYDTLGNHGIVDSYTAAILWKISASAEFLSSFALICVWIDVTLTYVCFFFLLISL